VKPAIDISAADPKAYQAKLIALVAGRDRVDILSRTPAALAELFDRHPAARWRVRPFEGKWTPNEILGHLVDIEWVYGFRVRAILCEHEPEIVAMDQETWVAGQRYNEREPADLLEQFTQLRNANVTLWQSVKPDEFARAGLHRQRGRETLDLCLTLHAGHDLSHIDQLTRYLAAAGGGNVRT
jgi:hypothetical protein